MAASYDLVPLIAASLDRHLLFPVLEFIQSKEIYPVEDVLRVKIDLLSKTNMLDFAMEIYRTLHKTEEVPQTLKERREQVVHQLKELQAQCGPLLRLLEDSALVEQLRKDKQWTAQTLLEKHDISADVFDSFYTYAKFQFDCGNYTLSANYLYHYIHLLFTNSERADRVLNAMWGKLASEILMRNWETALDDLNRLREHIEARSGVTPHIEQLQQRTWLMHWSLFIFFNHPNGKNGIIDLFFQEKYLNAITTHAPHILRYLTTAVISNKGRRNVLKELVKIIQQKHYKSNDPIIQFLECLYVDFDFDGAQVKLRECENVLKNDFFLEAYHDEFMENARLFIFETYCRIHQKLDIDMLAEKLNMKKDEAERWIVNLIRNVHIDAKIDSKAGQVLMGAQHASVHQQIIDRTKALSFRSVYLAHCVDQRLQALYQVQA
eukprot:TRINITY_DN11547_c0_g1::TRINITY_DN11547_c0_g1_i1::g.22095::m.22095 TRINITY_DN11547_c0_g1::TRINITY_DN11547_c0_g1_i1::g.22095  ORF type:complete len:449 (+),score=133.34,sp/B5DGH9/EIF3E_SALSA/56.51/3e-170,eIF3_N/PF09440.5/5.3e-38,eIF3_N/PF09440.5/7.4e+03,PCI/PF01399.22/37,PCI/PF01399.22/8.9e+03,PCI/PF01399.22/4.3e-17,PCI_Csn8/PF10075.4/0.034 TRINITY_DN11547_c0_g1_i1:44-1348(+)